VIPEENKPVFNLFNQSAKIRERLELDMVVSIRIIGQIFIVLSFLSGVFLPLTGLDLANRIQHHSQQEAEKVLRLIDRIQREQTQSDTGGTRKVVVTESELNAYIAHRIEVEQSKTLRELKLKIYERNRVEGKIYLDLRGQDLPKIMQPEMNIYLDGTIEVMKGLVRLKLKSLYLENQKIQPEMLNMVIYVASKSQGTEPFRLDDWFELPFGIKNIESERGQAAFYY
jgi:hypothetical protein